MNIWSKLFIALRHFKKIEIVSVKLSLDNQQYEGYKEFCYRCSGSGLVHTDHVERLSGSRRVNFYDIPNDSFQKCTSCQGTGYLILQKTRK